MPSEQEKWKKRNFGRVFPLDGCLFALQSPLKNPPRHWAEALGVEFGGGAAMKKFVLAAVATFALVGFVLAEEMTVSISKIDAAANAGNGSITYTVTKFGKKKDDAGDAKPVTANLVKNCKIAAGTFEKGGDKGFMVKEGDDLKDGLKNDLFKDLGKADSKGVFARITIADADDKDKGITKGDVTKVLTIQFKKKD
jgi:hypothetical protein